MDSDPGTVSSNPLLQLFSATYSVTATREMSSVQAFAAVESILEGPKDKLEG